MALFNLYFDSKETVWYRQGYNVEAETPEEAAERLKQFIAAQKFGNDEWVTERSGDYLMDTAEKMLLDENGGNATQVIMLDVTGNARELWSNEEDAGHLPICVQHNGVIVYHVYRNDDRHDVLREYWFTIDPDGMECDANAFDVRELSTWTGGDNEEAIIKAIIAAIEKGEINTYKIGDTVICNGQEDTIEKILSDDPDGYDVELKENGTQQWGKISKL